MRWWHVGPVHAIETASFPKDSWSADQFWQELSHVTRRYFVAVQDAAVVGYVGAFLLPPASDIQTIAVHEDFRGRGVGRRLLEHVEGVAKAEGARVLTIEVRQDNNDARNLYHVNGFSVVSRRSSYYPDGMDALIMQKGLVDPS